MSHAGDKRHSDSDDDGQPALKKRNTNDDPVEPKEPQETIVTDDEEEEAEEEKEEKAPEKQEEAGLDEDEYEHSVLDKDELATTASTDPTHNRLLILFGTKNVGSYAWLAPDEFPHPGDLPSIRGGKDYRYVLWLRKECALDREGRLKNFDVAAGFPAAAETMIIFSAD